jgi:hypothetical protein
MQRLPFLPSKTRGVTLCETLTIADFAAEFQNALPSKTRSINVHLFGYMVGEYTQLPILPF